MLFPFGKSEKCSIFRRTANGRPYIYLYNKRKFVNLRAYKKGTAVLPFLLL